MDDVAKYVKDVSWISEVEKEKILYKNAIELFGLDTSLMGS